MKNILKDLHPYEVFKHFEALSNIPRGSGNTKQAADFLVDFAKERNLNYILDDFGNVIIFKDAAGCNATEPVIIQGHIDMVTVKTPDCQKDLEKEGIDLIIDGDYIKADKTSLGADDGIAVAYALAILDSKDIIHPPIEAVFTTDEEIGLLGAAALDTGNLKGKTFLNIDSEDEGIFFAGCAGGATLNFTKKYDCEKEQGTLARLEINGLTGGHSGMEIDKKRANANKLMGEILFRLKDTPIKTSLLLLNGGEKDNAIPVGATAILILNKSDDINALEKEIVKISANLKEKYKKTDPSMQISVEFSQLNANHPVLPKEDALSLYQFLNECQDGVIKMSEDVEGLVDTSANTGIVSVDSTTAKITTSVRSNNNARKEALIEKFRQLACKYGFKIEVSGEYSSWEYKSESRVREIMLEAYREVRKKEAKVELIHAGLECGVFSSMMPKTDFISFGPQADDIHTYNEKLCISSVAAYWEILKKALEKLSKV